jgi:hypothetical protein
LKQEALIDPGPATHPRPRPTEHDESVRRAVAVASWKELKSHTDEGEDAREEILEQVTEALDLSYGDGYDMAKNLDRDHGWEGSEELVELCGSLLYRRRTECISAVRKWVAEARIAPKFAAGDLVKVKEYGNKWVDGTICEVSPEVAQYVVDCELQNRRGNYIIDYERVEARD